jgi:ATP-binding protein involved in chromosome partitioning
MISLKSLFNFAQPSPVITPDQILGALSTVLEPEVNRDIVSLGMVKNVRCRDGIVAFTLQLREAGTPLQVPIERRARQALKTIPGFKEVEITFATTPSSPLRNSNQLATSAKNIIAIASGKGGVGKSTVAVNLAVALAKMGHRVGLLDGDVYGPNVPIMMGVANEQPILFGDQIFPPTAHGVTVMSMGLLVPAAAPVIWRGPMLHQAIRQMARDVLWGELDYLLVDLPPGTGDIQLTLTQSLPLAGALLVTTPQAVATADVLKGGAMFQQLHVPLLGLVENMSYYLCGHCGERDYIFGQGGGERVSQQLGTTVIAQVPLDSAVRHQGDQGTPVVIAAPESPAAKALLGAAAALVERVNQLPPRKQPLSFVADPELKILA